MICIYLIWTGRIAIENRGDSSSGRQGPKSQDTSLDLDMRYARIISISLFVANAVRTYSDPVNIPEEDPYHKYWVEISFPLFQMRILPILSIIPSNAPISKSQPVG